MRAQPEYWCSANKGRIGLPGVHGLSQLLTLTSLDLVDSEVGDRVLCTGQPTGLVELHLVAAASAMLGACALSTHLTALNLCLDGNLIGDLGVVRA
jgi:hypothetical protein